MTLPLPSQVRDSDTQNNFDEIAQQFPIHRQNVGNDVVVLNSTTTAKQSKVSWGLIRGSDGVILAGSGDFTASRTSAGLYTITWTTAKAGTSYGIQLTTEWGPAANLWPNYTARTASKFDVQTRSPAADVDPVDWSFLVIDAQ